jgi:hypothetical protein
MRAMKGSLGHALKTELTDQERQDLLAYMQEHIPDESPDEVGAEE